MARKRYTIKTACPKCGCSSVTHLSEEEIREKFGDVSNVEMECLECTLRYSTRMEAACPEWHRDCRLNE